MGLKKLRDEIPIWWRSDTSSKENESKYKSSIKTNEKSDSGTSNASKARTLKKWFPETEVDNSEKPSEKRRKEQCSKSRLAEKGKHNREINPEPHPKKDSSRKDLKFSPSSSKLSFVIPDNFSTSESRETQSNCSCHTLPNSSSPPSSIICSGCSSFATSPPSHPPFSPFDTSSSFTFSSSSSSTSSSSSYSSYCTSTSYLDSNMISESSYSLSSNTTPKPNPVKEKKDFSKFYGDSSKELAKNVSCLGKRILEIQKLPVVSDIPLNPYFIKEWDSIETHRRNTYEEIRKLDGWEELKERLSSKSEIHSLSHKFLYSFDIFYIKIIPNEPNKTSKFVSKNLVPRITIFIKNGLFSRQEIQQCSNKKFNLNDTELIWGVEEFQPKNTQSYRRIYLSTTVLQGEEPGDYFSLEVEGVDLDEHEKNNSLNEKTKFPLGIAFCPLPKRNDIWEISIPLYSYFSDGNVLNNTYICSDLNFHREPFKNLGIIKFKISREKFDHQKLAVENREITDEFLLSKENTLTNEIKNEILSCLGAIQSLNVAREMENTQERNSVKKTIVNKEVFQSICPNNQIEQSLSFAEKELELKEREIQIKEKELEMEMRRLALHGIGQGGTHRDEKTEKNVVHHLSHHNEKEKSCNYFKVRGHEKGVYQKKQITRKSSRILSLDTENGYFKPETKTMKNKDSNNKKKPGKCKQRKKDKVNKKEPIEVKNSGKYEGSLKVQERYPLQTPFLFNPMVQISPQLYPQLYPQPYPNTITSSYILYHDPPNSNFQENSPQFEIENPTHQVTPTKAENLGLLSLNETKNKNERLGLANKYYEEKSRNLETEKPREGISNSLLKYKKNRNCFGEVQDYSFFDLGNSGKNKDDELKRKFLCRQIENFSVNYEVILNGFRACSNSHCRFREQEKLQYTVCEFTNREIDDWGICQFCQLDMFPSLNRVSEKQYRFVEFFFDASIPIFFPSRQLVWPTSLHFLLAQYFSDYTEVTKCKTHEEIVNLTKKKLNSLMDDIFPNLAVLVLIIKIFQHPVLQQLILTFTEKEFYLLKGHWLEQDPLLKLICQAPGSKFLNLGGKLVKALEELKEYIQRKQIKGSNFNS
ncbi:hypothetical protein HWI79_28 [Cryptosporidium felis]|nr:hypothetical protein HWI79_28 [Cryptosporidium felis]